jgi:hypothetical protein
MDLSCETLFISLMTTHCASDFCKSDEAKQAANGNKAMVILEGR